MPGVVEVIDVYRAEPEVLPALGQAVPEEPRSEAVAPARDLVRTQNFLVDELASNVLLVLLSRRRRRLFQGDVSALRADHELVAVCHAVHQSALDRRAYGPLGALTPVVDGGVDDVDAGSDRMPNRCLVFHVDFVGAVPEVGTDADRRERQLIRCGTKKVGDETLVKSLLESRAAGRGAAQRRWINLRRGRCDGRRSFRHG